MTKVEYRIRHSKLARAPGKLYGRMKERLTQDEVERIGYDTGPIAL